MSRTQGKSFFSAVGCVLGLILGWIGPPYEKLTNSTLVFSGWYWFTCLLCFAVLQFLLAGILQKPRLSRFVYFGSFVIPFSYVGSSLAFNSPQMPAISQILTLMMVMLLFAGIVAFFLGFASLALVRFFAGYDTSGLDEVDTAGYLIERLATSTERMTTTLLERCGFDPTWSDVSKDKSLETYLCQNTKPMALANSEDRDGKELISFAWFTLKNDTVHRYENPEEIADLKAQIEGLLEGWKNRDKILGFQVSSPNKERLIQNSAQFLGRLHVGMPHSVDIAGAIRSYPQKHPGQFAIMTAIIGSLITVIISYLLHLST